MWGKLNHFFNRFRFDSRKRSRGEATEKTISGDVYHAVDVFIRQGKAYIPTMARTESGQGPSYIAVSPVDITNLDIDKLSAAIARSYKAGNPVIPAPKLGEMAQLPHPLPKAANVRSWKQLYDNARSYSLSWNEDYIVRNVLVRPVRGRGLVVEPSLTLRFPIDTPVPELARSILDDARLHPEVFKGT
jgi:hypothetical protein